MSVRILQGDCRELLKTLPDGSVNCCVTSPPYFGLRDYGTAAWEGGDDDCDHVSGMARKDTGRATPGGKGGSFRGGEMQFLDVCGKCGATRTDRQMGLEPTPEAFVDGMVAAFRDVRRVLRDDGTLWLNMGDTYAGGGNGWGGSFAAERANWRVVPTRSGQRQAVGGCKAKDLVGIPWMLAFALRADGWFLRQDIIWSKPNPMPESVRDRCTKAHEYLFLLSKGPRYFYDQEAIAEPVSLSSMARLSQDVGAQLGSDRVPGKTNGPMKAVSRSGNKERKNRHDYGGNPAHPSGQAFGVPWEGSMRNRRSVWEVATQPFSEAHFATYPPALIEPCILAGCPKGGTVLDPFFGAGTTGLVADRLQRDCIGIELNPEYAALARKRLEQCAGMFAEVLAA